MLPPAYMTDVRKRKQCGPNQTAPYMDQCCLHSTRDVRKELLISISRLQISSKPKSAHFMP